MIIEPFFESAHRDLIYNLESHGFSTLDGDVWTGDIESLSGPRSVKISLSPPYPFRPPLVIPQVDTPLTWHQNVDQSLCLYSQTSPGKFPWLAHNNLISMISEWFRQSEGGWMGAPPDLDLERYWPRDTRFSLVTHRSLRGQTNKWIQLRRGVAPATLSERNHSTPPSRRPKSHKYLYARVVDVGEVGLPPRTWGEIRLLLPDAEHTERLVHSRKADLILVRYSQGGAEGVLGLVPVDFRQNPLAFRAVPCAEVSEATDHLRRGPQADALKDRTIAIVGVGAIGSFVAEGLYRSGMKKLFLLDGELLRPGNLVRHAAASTVVGFRKATAMARTLDPSSLSVCSVEGFVVTLEDARALLKSVDLVVDATANEVVTSLLTYAAEEQGKTIVSTYLTNQGRSKVIEVLPASERVRPPELAPLAADGVESGCGDAVSPTPPFAVQEVAAMACRKVVEILTDPSKRALAEDRESV